MRKSWFFPIAAGLLLTGCATLPTGPDVLVLPGSGKGLDEFQLDDAVCRQWASQQVGATGKQPAGSPAAGTERGAGAEWRSQRRYDMAYMQCMYTKGNQIPVRGSFQQPPASAQQGSSAPFPLDVPPPPPGNPPPPPTGY